MCILKFVFEYGSASSCVWSVNEEAEEKFNGYTIEHEALGISKELNLRMTALCKEFQTSLNWDDPAGASPWTGSQRGDFKRRASAAYEDLIKELGDGYKVEYWVR